MFHFKSQSSVATSTLCNSNFFIQVCLPVGCVSPDAVVVMEGVVYTPLSTPPAHIHAGIHHPPPPPRGQNDRQVYKHYLPATSFAADNDAGLFLL